MKSAYEMVSALDGAATALSTAIDLIDGSGADAEKDVLVLMETLADIKTELAKYEKQMDEEYEADLESLRNEYERSVL